jgi:hypothetical protein
VRRRVHADRFPNVRGLSKRQAASRGVPDAQLLPIAGLRSSGKGANKTSLVRTV